MASNPSILLIEDSPGECELFRLALVQTGLEVTLYTEHDAEAAFRFLEGQWKARAVVPSHLEVKAKAEVKASASTTGKNQAHELLSHLNSRSTSASTLTFSSHPHSASTGDQSGHPHPLPSLILLDLQLCGRNGCDLLKRLRADARFAVIPVVVFTTSDDPQDLTACYASGTNGYVVKPGTFEQLVHCTMDLCRYWIDWNRVPPRAETRC